MSDSLTDSDNVDEPERPSRPSLAQIKALVEFIQQRPTMALKKQGNIEAQQKVKKLWVRLSEKLNSLDGAVKRTKSWMKFWADKKRYVLTKQKQILDGTLQSSFSSIDQKIIDLCQSDKPTVKKRKVKMETCNGDNESIEDLFPETEELEFMDNNRVSSTEAEERQLAMMEKLVTVMNQQAQAMGQMAQSTLSNSKALERLAEASHMQALAVDRLANSFESIGSSVHDVKNAILSIDYTMKRCYPATTTQRQNPNLFS